MRRSILLALAVAFVAFVAVYIRVRPLVFNDSFFGHAHCIKGGGLALAFYAQGHGGKFPAHSNGYGDALLLMTNEISGWWSSVTGPGYDEKPFLAALASRSSLPEQACGRVYVQGLSQTNDPAIALLFDKIATPGGDHCHFFRRLWTPLLREVWTVGGEVTTVRERDWPVYAQKQVELLLAAGIPQTQAKALYGIIK